MRRNETGEWTEVMPCLVCGTLVNGYRNANGAVTMVRKAIGRRHFTIECYTARDAFDGAVTAPP